MNNNNWKKKFLIIATGQSISLIGSSAVQFALIWWLASETNSPMIMALSGLVAFLPQLCLGPFAGVWIDRMKRKHVVIAADLFMGLLAGIFAVGFQLGTPPYWIICVVLGIRSVGNVFHTPAMQALVPILVPTDQLVKVNGWSQLMQSGSFILGPIVGAAMFSVLPMSWILATDLLGAIAACLCLWGVVIDEPAAEQKEAPHFMRELKEGAQVLVSDRKLMIATITTVACMVFFLPLSSYYPLMSSSYFARAAIYGGLVELLYAVGMMIAAFLFSLVKEVKYKFVIIYIGLMGIGATSLVCGLLPPEPWAYWVFAAICCIMGASGNIYGIPMMAYMQEAIDPQAQGRVFSLIGSVMSAAMPLGLLLSGPLAEKYGVNGWFLITGIAVIFFVLLGSGISVCWYQKNKF